ncbi:MAG: glycine zipper family protein, partial [Candidatus Rokuibacteriota bacterium]
MRALALLLVGALGAGCATVPPGPSVSVLPGRGKRFEQFQDDDVACRQWARQEAGTTPGASAAQSTVGGAAIGTLLGAGLGAALGAATHRPAAGAAVGAGIGLIGGTAVGAGAGQTSGQTVQRRYDNAYTQCMFAKGDQVTGRAGAPSVRPRPAAPAPGAPWGTSTACTRCSGGGGRCGPR